MTDPVKEKGKIEAAVKCLIMRAIINMSVRFVYKACISKLIFLHIIHKHATLIIESRPWWCKHIYKFTKAG